MIKGKRFFLFDTTNVNNSINNSFLERFQKYIIEKTDYHSVYFFGYADDGCMLCNALTNINGHQVTTGWKITREFEFKLTTLIETTERYYEKKDQIRRLRKVNFR